MKEKKVLHKIWNIIKIVLLAITSPIWFPWKLLFGRSLLKEGEQNVFKITGISILNILKLTVFMVVIFLELLVVHKIRYSPITYPLTRNSVREYYLNENRIELDGLDETTKSEFEIMLDTIDTWDLDPKNKIHVILNSNLVKNLIKYSDNETVNYIINKFNRDATFRSDLETSLKDIDSSITRFIKEIPENDFNRLNNFLNPIVTITSWALDYASVLDIGSTVFDWAKDELNIRENSLHATASDIDKAIKTVIDFSKGSSLTTVTNYWK